MFLLIDNDDSFTYNLYQIFTSLGVEPKIFKQDNPEIVKFAKEGLITRVCLYPGYGQLSESENYLNFLKHLDKNIPLLAIANSSLGLAQFLGGKIIKAQENIFGKAITIKNSKCPIYNNLPETIEVGAYYSHTLDKNAPLQITSVDKQGQIMSFSANNNLWHGLLFNPESVLTKNKEIILNNFLEIQQGEKSVSETKRNSINFQKNDDIASISFILETLLQKEDLNQYLAEQMFTRLMDGEFSQAQAGALLTALRAKGESPLEMAVAAEVILKKAVLPPKDLNRMAIDVVGTGGDGQNSFNCSTGSALILAAMGYPVLKHGNRSVSSRCGSADVLERLGLSIDTPPENLAKDLKKNNFAFLLASKYHPTFKNIMPVRRELAIRSIFNLLGPLVNPARPHYRLIGVPKKQYLSLIAGALAHLGDSNSAVVYGAGGYDELTPLGVNSIIMVNGGKMAEMELDPQKYGLKKCSKEDLAIENPQDGEKVLRQLLSGTGPKAMADMLALNVALALHLIDSLDLTDALEKAKNFIKSGKTGEIFLNA